MTDWSIILVSGGVESMTLLHREARRASVVPLFVDYGQRALEAERRTVRNQCRILDLEPVELDLSRVGRRFHGTALMRAHVPLPHRNMVLLSLGFSYGARIGARRIYLALNRADAHAYASAGTPFLDAFRHMIDILEPDLALCTPFIELHKAQVIQIGQSLGLDFARTYSCLLGHARHCGVCPQCCKRRDAFQAAGLAEPERFYRRTPG
ncbi:MAG: ExsB family protein [Chromatiales bacterium 21-64-14]|nr:MAG: ExsB family protein [Chromatiales bacterium 21-64-14]HQU16503.1 7-cyano-7-deazaguanine synthase [Gammaproteobacteria bacterium]